MCQVEIASASPRNDITPDNHNNKEIMGNLRLSLPDGRQVRPIFFLTFLKKCVITITALLYIGFQEFYIMRNAF